jgi:preprotein translocase subunit SecG
MSGFLLTLHVIVSLLLIGVILLQPGSKGGGLGATFGGGGANSAFGAQGAAPFLSKFTYWLAGGFMITCLVIEVLIVKENRSVLDRTNAAKAAPAKISAPAPAPVPVPALPSAPTKK